MEYCQFVYKSWSKIQKEKYEKILDFLPKKAFENKNILDIGSGPGYFLNFLKNDKISFNCYLGIDPSKEHILEAIKTIKNPKKENFILANFENLPINLDFFNVFLFFDVVHLVNLNEVLDFINNAVLKEDFIVVISLFKRKSNILEKIKENLETNSKHGFKIKYFNLPNLQEEEMVLIISSD